MKRSTPLTRRSPLARGVSIRRRNEKRSRERKARNFGDEADAVRAMPCLCNAGLCTELQDMGSRADDPRNTEALFHRWCSGSIQAAHVTARGMGGAKGGRFDIVPLCAAHHQNAGELGTSQRTDFQKRYGLDLRAEADRIALEHAPPLGIRGLARRWVAELAIASMEVEATDEQVQLVCKHEPLNDYERDALLGWVRRRMEREVERRAAHARQWSVMGLDPYDREALAHAVMLDLGEPFTSDPHGEHGLAWSLCETAGWPSEVCDE